MSDVDIGWRGWCRSGSKDGTGEREKRGELIEKKKQRETESGRDRR